MIYLSAVVCACITHGTQFDAMRHKFHIKIFRLTHTYLRMSSIGIPVTLQLGSNTQCCGANICMYGCILTRRLWMSNGAARVEDKRSWWITVLAVSIQKNVNKPNSTLSWVIAKEWHWKCLMPRLKRSWTGNRRWKPDLSKWCVLTVYGPFDVWKQGK